jgi:putative hydrolase of the HAD superfamily
MMRIGIAADHAGFVLKGELAAILRHAGHDVYDFGAVQLDAEDDYPDFVVPLARAVAAGEVERGVALCGSGIGACVVANKVAGVQAGLINDVFSARQGVEDDDMNMCCLGAKVIGPALAAELITVFLAAQFTGAVRHQRRLAKVRAAAWAHDDSTEHSTPAIPAPIPTCLLLDIGGVLLNDGWDHHSRQRAAAHFALDWSEMEARHSLNFETYEEGKLTLGEYLNRVVFYRERAFSRETFQHFMFAQSICYPEMIGMVARLKARYGLKIGVLSNEARELNAYRIHKFKIGEVVDFFISSCFVHIRKPDADIFRLALDIAQVPAAQVVFIENTPMFVEIAESLGMRGIAHTDYSATCAQLAQLGLPFDEDTSHDNG